MTIVQRKNKPFTTPSSNNSIGDSLSDHHHASAPTSATINLGGRLQINKPTNSGVEYSSSKNRVSGFMVMTVVSFTSVIVTLVMVCIFSMELLLEKAAESNNIMNYPVVGIMKHKPRLVYLSTNRMNDQESTLFSVDPILYVTPGEESIEQVDEVDKDQANCVPMATWQTKSYPTCNLVHEISMEEFGYQPLLQSQIGDRTIKIGPYTVISDTVPYSYTNVKSMGKGWYRQTWRVDSFMENFVLKTLR